METFKDKVAVVTGGALGINENADLDVRVDMETIFNRLVPENW